jgi:hypothetical protein
MRRKYPKPVSVFLAALLEESSQLISKEKLEASPGLIESINADLLGLPQPQKLPLKTELSSHEKCFQELFYGFGEIAEAYETLNDLMSLVRFTPPKTFNINKVRYLKFLKDAYFNEFYIFQQRIDAYLGKISHLYKTDPVVPNIAKTVAALRKAINSCTNNFIGMRSSHVHKQRYTATDEDMRRLNLLQILAEHSEMKRKMRVLYSLAFRDAQRHTKQKFREWNSAARAIIVGTFDVLNRQLLDKRKKLIYPVSKSQNRVTAGKK